MTNKKSLDSKSQNKEVYRTDTVNDLKEFNLKVIVPGYCTGWRAVHEMLNTFGKK